MVQALFRELGYSGTGVTVGDPGNASFGDLSSSSAMGLAKILGKPPKVIAGVMAGGVRGFDFVSSVKVDGPGFVNITLAPGYLVSVAGRLAREGLGGMLGEGGPRGRAMVEFVSSNPTGPLTVGHCRQAVLGDAISRLLEAVGWSVHREYYFNDAGRQMERLAESLAARYDQLSGGNTPVPEGGYQGDYIADWARDLLSRSGNLAWPGDREVFRREAVDRAFRLIRDDLELLGIRFDRYFAESELIPDAVEDALKALEAAGLAWADPDGSGRTWLKLTALGRPEDRVVKRPGGGYTYRMPDIAYHLDKFSRGFDLLVDVFGSDHIDTSRDVEAAVAALLGAERVGRVLRTVIHQFVTLSRGGESVKMSTRAGEFVTLRDLVTEVGSPDVTRYLFLTRKAEAHMDFDLEAAARNTEENPVYYIQYAFARIAGILRTAEGSFTWREDGREESLLTEPRERELLRLLEALSVRVSEAADELAPHRITDAAAELATAFHGFYAHHRVMDPENPPLSRARMLLCLACREGLKGLLGVLGVSAPERM
jgi:arginyl-tRNA synthetase